MGAVFYHSYSQAALLYEVQAALAAVLFGFGAQFGTLPRLLGRWFAECPDAPTMLKLFPTWPEQDHNTCCRAVSICCTTNLLDESQLEAPPPKVFMEGFSTAIKVLSLVQSTLTACGVPADIASKSISRIVALAEKYGLGRICQKSGEFYPLNPCGHMLQIFIKRHLVDKYAYAAMPFGVPDPSRTPLQAHMNRSNRVTGQIRLVANPSAFLFNGKLRTFTFSANRAFHCARRQFQKELINELNYVLGDDTSDREMATECLFDGVLPAWYNADDIDRVRAWSHNW